MKIKILPILAVLVLSASCMKTRNCTCVTKYPDGATETETHSITSLGGHPSFKSAAKAECEANNSSSQGYSVNCKLSK